MCDLTIPINQEDIFPGELGTVSSLKCVAAVGQGVKLSECREATGIQPLKEAQGEGGSISLRKDPLIK